MMLLSVPKASVRSKEMLEVLPLNTRSKQGTRQGQYSTRAVEGPKDSFFVVVISVFWLHHTSCRILVPQPGIEPAPPIAVGFRTEVDSLLVGVQIGADLMGLIWPSLLLIK